MALALTAALQERTQKKLGDLLFLSGVYVTLNESTLVAATTMPDHGVCLPVVRSKSELRPVDYLRRDKIGHRLI